MEENIDIQEAAKRLGRKLTGRVEHVVGVSLRCPDPAVRRLELYVDVDGDLLSVRADIPTTFLGYPVHIRRIGTPVFARN